MRLELWKTMEAIKAGEISSDTAHALASQAREIVRIVRVELDIALALTQKPSYQLQRFANLHNESRKN